MRFSVTAALAFAGAAVAQTTGFDALTSPAQGQSVAAGSTFEIDWEPTTHTSDTVSIILLGGATPSTLEIKSTIASGITNSVAKYSWPVDATLGSLATYGLKIQLDSDPTIFQYSFPFQITGGKVSSSSSSSASGSASTTGAGSSSSSSSGSGSSTTLTTASSSSSIAATTTVVTTASVPGNLSTTRVPTKTLTSVVSGSGTASGSASVSTGAASNVGASSIAFLGGLALAVLAL